MNEQKMKKETDSDEDFELKLSVVIPKGKGATIEVVGKQNELLSGLVMLTLAVANATRLDPKVAAGTILSAIMKNPDKVAVSQRAIKQQSTVADMIKMRQEVKAAEEKSNNETKH